MVSSKQNPINILIRELWEKSRDDMKSGCFGIVKLLSALMISTFCIHVFIKHTCMYNVFSRSYKM